MGLVSRSKVSASSVRESLNQMNSNRTSSVEPILQCFNKSLFHASNLCTPFKHDIRCTSLCGVEFVVTKERREKRAQRESCLKGVRSLHHQGKNISNMSSLQPATNGSLVAYHTTDCSLQFHYMDQVLLF